MAIQDGDGRRDGRGVSSSCSWHVVRFVDHVAAFKARDCAPTGSKCTAHDIFGLTGLRGDGGLLAGAGAPGINIFVDPRRKKVVMGRITSAMDCLASFSGSESCKRLGLELYVRSSTRLSTLGGKSVLEGLLPLYGRRIVCPPKLTKRIRV